MDRISVIIPVYKVEPYLDRCVQSVVEQTYTDLEIILVDDGSPDNCPAMCDAWAEKDPRIRVIHKENGGLSDARNAGMAAATGEYIGFVDSDDWIDSKMYQSLHEAITTTDSDIAVCGARRIWMDGTPDKELRTENRDCVFDHEAAMEAFVTSDALVQTVWNKLYRKSVVEGILFPKGLNHEDEFWSWRAVAKAGRVVTCKESYYNYLQRDGSIMGAGFSEKNLLVVRAKTERQNYIEDAMPNLKDVSRAELIYTCMHLGVDVIRTMRPKEAVTYLKYLKNTVKNYPVSGAYLRLLPWKKRLHMQMIQSLFALMCLLHSIG